MLNAVRNNQKLAFFEPHVTVSKFHSESTLHDQEKFIFGIVMMPDKWASEFDQLDLLTVEVPDHPRREVIGEQRELFFKVDLLHAASLARFNPIPGALLAVIPAACESNTNPRC